jgi:hypothetical protein
MGRNRFSVPTAALLLLSLSFYASPPATAKEDGVFVEIQRHLQGIEYWGEVLIRIRRVWSMNRDDLQKYIQISPERADRISRAGRTAEVSSFSSTEIALIIQFLILYEPNPFPTTLAKHPKVIELFAEARKATHPSVRELSDLLKERATRPYATSSNGLPSILDIAPNVTQMGFEGPLTLWHEFSDLRELLTKHGTETLWSSYVDFLQQRVVSSLNEIARRYPPPRDESVPSLLTYLSPAPAFERDAFMRFIESPLVYPLPYSVLSRLKRSGVTALHEAFADPGLSQDLALFQARLAQEAERLSSRETVAEALASKKAAQTDMFHDFVSVEADSKFVAEKYRKLVTLADRAAYLPDGDRSLILDEREQTLLIYFVKHLKAAHKACRALI